MSVKAVNLTTQPGNPDKNPRVVLHAKILLGPKTSDVADIVVVHFSYDRQQQCQNARDVLEHLSLGITLTGCVYNVLYLICMYINKTSATPSPGKYIPLKKEF